MLPPPPRLDTLVESDHATNPTMVKVREIETVPSNGMPDIPGYEVISELGKGGMGRVYQARHLGLNRMDAIKMVIGNSNPRTLTRFADEARAIAKLKHANIAQVYDTGEVKGQPYYAMELVEAGTLTQKLDGEPIDAKQAARLVMTLARAVDYFNQQGIIHRDLKPSNILMTKQGEPKIADFGLVKNLEGDSQQTQTGDVVGSPSYMSPEQASGMVKSIGPSTDIYSLGAILYQCLTGRPPFQTSDPMQTLMAVISNDPVPVRQLIPGTPRDINTICMKCLEKQPGKRYATAGALAGDLQRFLNGETILARPAGVIEKSWKWCRRRPAWATVIALGLLTLIGSALGYLQLRYAYQQLDEAKRESDLQSAATRAVLDRMIVHYSEDLAGIPQTEKIRQQGLEDARNMYERLLRNKPNDEIARAQYVESCMQLASIERSLGAYTRAEEAYQKAMVVLDQLIRESSSQDHLGRYLDVLQSRASLCHDQGQQEAGNQQLQLAEPFFKRLEGEALTANLAKSLGSYYGTLGQNHRMAQRFSDAESAYRKAIEYQQKAVQLADETDTKSRSGLAVAHNSLGTILLIQSKFQPAAEEFQKALNLLPRDSQPNKIYLRAMINSNQAIVYDSLKNFSEADKAYANASAVFQQLMNDYPMMPEYRFRWCKSRVNLIRSMLPREYVKAPGIIAEVEPVLKKLVEDYPQQKVYRDEVKILDNCKEIFKYLQKEAAEK
ncbi:MAG: protein kinase [Planctomycetia bacterium]|nr:protein kinase [Planctomycetia bacterium]